MKKFMLSAASLLLLIGLFFSTQASASTSKELAAMMDQKIIMGDSNGNPMSGKKVTRGEFAAIMQRALQLPEGDSQFKDVAKSSPLAKGISAVVRAKIASGYSKILFGPNDSITREQMAAMISNALDYLGIAPKEAPLSFVDTNQISPKWKAVVASMVGYKIILGNAKNEYLPKDTATRDHAAKFVYRMLEVKKSHDGASENNNLYIVTKVKADGSFSASQQKFSSFAEANDKWTASTGEVIVKNDKVIKMDKGIAVATANGETVVYENKKLKMPLERGSEMEYISSDDQDVSVKVAGHPYTVNLADVKLIPEQTFNGKRSFYKVDGKRNLTHNVYNYLTKSSDSYFYGKAPTGLAEGTYYSWDGVHFTDSKGNDAGTFYQYFNMLPYRTNTNYTADDLNQIILKKLQSLEASGNSAFKGATKNSKLLNIGQTLKEAENKYKINAFMMLSQAIVESNYGLSDIAKNKNNIFGIHAHDGNTSAAIKFDTTEDCVVYLADKVLNKTYITTELNSYGNGSNLGNKYRGINVKYASDQYWGQKIAGVMYNLDLDGGGKDFINNPTTYSLYQVTSPEGLNVRSEPSVSSLALYRFDASQTGFPVTVISSEKGADYTWHKILSDSLKAPYGYVAGGKGDIDYIKPLPIVK
ncbi:S-layer homology domain-containing protein [Bacillus sp. 1P06AnD]|uniref:S-layer homology domain-containing protein n=1 Tax=Bacillus sp. 1P06AnD TaxID=3132208 RepID=UPI0039A24A48